MLGVVWFLSTLGVVTGVHDLYLLGLFPLEGAWRGGAGQVVAVEMALAEVNAREDILPGYRLNLIWNNTKCDPGIGVDIMYKNLISPPTKVMIIGAACSIVSQATAQASHLWNMVQMSYISVSPALSDKTRFPRFFRANTPDVDVNPAIVDIFKQFGWSSIATIHQSYELFSAPIADLIKRMKAANITIVRSEIISSTPQIQVENLKTNDVRIIVGSFYADMAQQVFCHAYKVGLYGPKVVWVVNGWYETEWWKVDNPLIDCTVEQLAEAVEGYWAVDRIYQNPRGEKALSGLTPKEFLDQYASRTTPDMPGLRYGPMTYDTIWAICLALNGTLTDLKNNGSSKGLEDFDYSDDDMGMLLLDNTRRVEFLGVRGHFRFNDKGDMISLYRVDRLQNNKIDMVGLYDANLQTDVKIEWLVDSAPVNWHGNKVPKDSVQVIRKLERLPLSMYICMCALAGLGIVLSCLFLAFNIHFRKIKIVKMSSPRLNNLILIGCLLLYVTVFLYDMTSTVVGDICKVKVLLLVIGFSFAFGALFAKTWRVHYIFTNATKQKKILTDTQLFVMVGALVGLNSTVVVVWVLVDPVAVVNKDSIPQRDEANDRETRAYVETCESRNQLYFSATLFGIQGILLLLGTFLAWETRKVKIEGLNDSKMIGICIYNVVVLSVLGVTVSMAMGDQVSLNYCLTSLVVIIATTVTQCLIIVPKITAYKQNKTQVGDDNTGTVTTRAPNTVNTHLAPPSLATTTDARVAALQAQVQKRDKMILVLNGEVTQLKAQLEAAKTVNKTDSSTDDTTDINASEIRLDSKTAKEIAVTEAMTDTSRADTLDTELDLNTETENTTLANTHDEQSVSLP
ncbi:gamma-aminobutyric acid type B receptor subunit 1-like [Haliotis rubra]|uniref:gamma-aminobutyric acid type B receptor subunit 1-like n=1 Tax=Haliotis rubra TaxID=36100 RepID=UPI001EE5DB7E|nr:gamma-aminobutyric acid type B receptor subunit 1-like [Haliotis rubra]